MQEELFLSDLSDGELVEIASIEASDLKVKLLEMGMTEGKSLEVLFHAPLGDPIAIDVDGYVLSLRQDEASLIKVKRLSN